MNTKLQDSAALIGRILLALIFIMSGYGKITGYAGTAAYMASNGLPMVAVLLPLTILVELGSSLLIVIGWKARWAAAALFLFLIPVTLVFRSGMLLFLGGAGGGIALAVQILRSDTHR